MASLSGYLLVWPSRQDLTRDAFEIRGLVDGAAPSLRYQKVLYQLRAWEEFEFLSPEALTDETAISDNITGPYAYRVVCVRLGASVLLLTERRDISDYLLSRILAKRIYPNLRKARFHIGLIIESCRNADSEYLITSLVGRFAGSEHQLRTMTLYGDDVTESAVFQEHHHLFNFTSCGVGYRLVNGLPRLSPGEDHEIVRLGSDGAVSFVQGGRRRARDVSTIVDYVIQAGWIDDWTSG